MKEGEMRGREQGALQELVATFQRLLRDGLTSLAVPWLAIAAVDLLFVGTSIGIVLAVGAEPGRGGFGALQVIGGLQAVAVMTLRVALLGVLRDVAMLGPTGVVSFGGVLRQVAGRIWASLGITLVVGLLIGVGLALCVLPGLVALFFLAFAPYLVAGRGMGIGASLGESARWARRHWTVVLSALLVAVVASAGVGCVVGTLSTVQGQGPLAITFGLAGGWVLNTILGYLAFLWWGAVYVLVEEREQVTHLEKSAPGRES